MHVSATTGATYAPAAAASSDAGNAALNYNAFLQLLMAEMRNQDPTQPSDPTQSLSQLASFSAVEQSIKTNAKLDDLLSLQRLGQATGFIGHTLTSADGKITGVCKSLAITSDGVVATLDTGKKLTIGPGITVS